MVKKTKSISRINIKQLEKKIKSIIAEVLEVNQKKITPEAKLVTDLGMDSMKALEILAAIERTYRIAIPEESLSKIVSLKEILNLTQGLLKIGHK